MSILTNLLNTDFTSPDQGLISVFQSSLVQNNNLWGEGTLFTGENNLSKITAAVNRALMEKDVTEVEETQVRHILSKLVPLKLSFIQRLFLPFFSQLKEKQIRYQTFNSQLGPNWNKEKAEVIHTLFWKKRLKTDPRALRIDTEKSVMYLYSNLKLFETSKLNKKFNSLFKPHVPISSEALLGSFFHEVRSLSADYIKHQPVKKTALKITEAESREFERIADEYLNHTHAAEGFVKMQASLSGHFEGVYGTDEIAAQAEKFYTCCAHNSELLIKILSVTDIESYGPATSTYFYAHFGIVATLFDNLN